MTLTLDDDWFQKERGCLLRPLRTPEPIGFRTVQSLLDGSGGRLDPSAQEWSERARGRLASRHSSAVRAHAQLYRACLESTALVPSEALVQAGAQIEWFWYTTPFKAFYRDHLAHVMKVALTALELLQSRESPLAANGRRAVDWIAEELAEGRLGCDALRRCARRLGNGDEHLREGAFWRNVLLEAAKLAGLLHDLAYPHQMAQRLRRAAAPVNPLGPFEPAVGDAVARTIEVIDDTLVAWPFSEGRSGPLRPQGRKVAADVLAASHSLQAGAVLLECRAASDRVWALSPEESFSIEWAALAASMHDYDKLFAKPGGDGLASWLASKPNLAAVRPCFERDPLSYLIALADQLQDFGRAHYEAADGADCDRVNLRIRYPWKQVRLEADGRGKLSVIFVMAPDEDTAFGVPGSEKRLELEARRRKDAEAVWGRNGWLDHTGAFTEVATSVER